MDYQESWLIGRPYHVSDLEEISSILAEGYVSENKQLYQGLKLTREDLYNAFRNALLENIYPLSVVVVRRGSEEIVGCIFYRDTQLIPIDLADPQLTRTNTFQRFLLQSATTIVRQAVKPNIKMCYSSMFGIKAKYRGLGFGVAIVYEGLKMLRREGYLNHGELAQVPLTELTLADGKVQPFKNAPIIFNVFLIDIEGTIKHNESLIENYQPRL